MLTCYLHPMDAVCSAGPARVIFADNVSTTPAAITTTPSFCLCSSQQMY